MGTYLNPGYIGFQEILQSEYVDKTGLIALANRTVGTMTFLSAAQRKGASLKDVPNMMVDAIQTELGELYPECVSGNNLTDSLIRCVNRTGRIFADSGNRS